MKAADQFHAGLVVDDFEATLERLSTLFGYEWCDEMRVPTSVRYADGADAVIDVAFTYSKSVPRLEVIRPIPGTTIWQPATDAGVHHLGYWSDDVPADSAALTKQGFDLEVAGVGPDGAPYWAYHRFPGGARIELVSRAVQPGLSQYWS